MQRSREYDDRECRRQKRSTESMRKKDVRCLLIRNGRHDAFAETMADCADDAV